MRILAIRGANLASLADPFEVDLTAEPLAGAGLFAIAGDTGAGKSTILDALCLALYGTYPRAVSGRDETVSDASGKALSAGDERNILSRGAVSGFAEADFAGQDGVAYTARWEVRRARGKRDGRLQDADRRLDLLDKTASIATGIKPVLDAVVARTGLTFDQFKRTVLLAQGEFDAFLLADPKARSDLLEKITGTEIYTRISRQTHLATTERERAVADLERDMASIGVLAAADRSALLADETALKTALQQATFTSERLSQAVAQVQALNGAKALLEVERRRHADAEEGFRLAADDRAKLRAIERAATARSKSDDVMRLRDESAEAKAALARTDYARTLAQSAETAALDKRLACDAALTATRAVVLEFEPVWRQAERLDAQIATARTLLGQAADALTQAQSEAARRRSQAAAAEATLAEARAAAAELDTQLHETLPHARLADQAEIVRRLFAARAQTVSKLAEATAAQRKAAAQLAPLERAIAEKAAALEAAEVRRDALVGEIADAVDALARIDVPALRTREAALRELTAALEVARAMAAELEIAAADHTTADATLTNALTAQREARAQRDEAAESLAHLKTARAEILPFADLADATLSDVAARLRSALLKGEACPVCGAIEHPAVNDACAGTRMAVSIRDRRDALNRETETASERMTEIERAIASAQGKWQSADEARQRAAATVADLGPKLADSLTSIRGLVSAAGLDGLRELSPGDGAGRIAAALVEAETARSAIAHQLAEASAAHGALEVLRVQRDQALADLAATGEGVRAATRLREAACTAGRDAALAVTALIERREDQDSDLGPYLACAGVGLAEVDRDAEAACRTLLAIGAARRQLGASIAEATATLTNFDRANYEARLAAEAADRHVASAGADVETRQAALSPLVGSRAALLCGEATDSHRARMTLTLAAAAATAAENVAREWTKATAELAAAAQAHEAARHAVTMAAARLSGAEGALDTIAATLEMTLPEIASLLAVPHDEVERLRDRHNAVTLARVTAQDRLETRTRDLAKLLADSPDAETANLEVLTAEREAAARTRDGLNGRLGELASTIRSDDEARAKAAGLELAIQTARDELAVWADVNEAIGSQAGDKFRKFAQGVTLGQLVALANGHLAALNPRYALARAKASDLALEVVDRDMIDEVRSPRSLSGGERFLVSLALALALSGLDGTASLVDSLFIDEGFGSLDRETLDIAIDALERLQNAGRKVGVITHVAAMIERIGVQVRVDKRGGGRSIVRTFDAATAVHGSFQDRAK